MSKRIYTLPVKTPEQWLSEWIVSSLVMQFWGKNGKVPKRFKNLRIKGLRIITEAD